MESLKNLLQALQLEPPPSASEEEIARFETEAGLKLPESVYQFYRSCNGLVLQKNLKILSLDGSLHYLQALRDAGISQRWGYVPLVDNNDSNPLCVCCNEPLTGYLVQVSHDDATMLRFRSLDRFIAQLYESAPQFNWDVTNLPSDFAVSTRTDEDIQIGHTLLHLGAQLHDIERNESYRFAIWLFSDRQVDEIAALLQHEDLYVREDAQHRLMALKTPQAEQALKTYQDELRQFAEKCVAVFQQHHIKATVVQDKSLRVEFALNLPWFYSKRNAPDLANILFEHIKSLF